MTVESIKKERKIFYWGCGILVVSFAVWMGLVIGLDYEVTQEKCVECVSSTCAACLKLEKLDALETAIDYERQYPSWFRGGKALTILGYIILLLRFSIKLKLHWALCTFYAVCALVYVIFWMVPFVMLGIHSKWAIERLNSENPNGSSS